MAMRIALAEVIHAVRGATFPLTFPLSFGGDGPSGAPLLSPLVDAAVLRVTGEPAQIFNAESPFIEGVEALIWERGAFMPESMLEAWPGIRAVAIDLGNSTHAPYSWHPDGGYDVIAIDPSELDRSVSAVARWLVGAQGDGITAGEGQRLEVLIREVQRLLEGALPTTEELRDDIAQVQAAVDTIQAQLKAPRPIRRIVGWALTQVSGLAVGYVAGVASSATLPHLPELLRAFPH